MAIRLIIAVIPMGSQPFIQFDADTSRHSSNLTFKLFL